MFLNRMKVASRNILRLLTPLLLAYIIFVTLASFYNGKINVCHFYVDGTNDELIERPVSDKEYASVSPELSDFNENKGQEGQQKDSRIYNIVIDGIIFKLQYGKPKGISVVWKNLIPELAKRFPSPHKVFFVDPTPEQEICQEIAAHDNVIHVPLNGGPEAGVNHVLKDLEHQSPKQVNGGPIVVFFSTYYSFPWGIPDICNIMMYHDLIPEMVGMDHGPGSEYYPRIDGLKRINSIVSVSYSTSKDLVTMYGKDVKKTNQDLFYDKDSDPNPLTKNTIVATVQNRISRDVFPGPSSMEKVRQFRAEYHLYDNEDPLYVKEDVPIDYFLTVGASYNYKNFDTLFKAIELIPDDVLSRISFVMTGRTHDISDNEKKSIATHPLVIRTDTGEKTYPVYTRKGVNDELVPVKIRMIPYMAEKNLPTAYTGAVGLIYISSYEGFGLPLAEALTSGTLAVATNSSSLPEVGGPDIFYVNNPRDPVQVRDKIVELAQSSYEERESRISKSIKYVEKFGGGGSGGIGHGWDEMGRLIADHIRGTKHRGSQCYTPKYIFK